MLYVTFASYADMLPYDGWVMAYDPATFRQLAAFNTTPNSSGAGIWQAGQGLAADADGAVYAFTGNQCPAPYCAEAPHPFRPGVDLSDSVLKLRLTANGTPVRLELRDWFTSIWSDMHAPNANCEGDCLSQQDADLGSAGPLILPDGRVVGGGKQGKLYSLPRASLGHMQTSLDGVFPDVFQATTGPPQGHCSEKDSHIHGAPVYWDGPAGEMLYIGENDFLRAYAADTWIAPGKTTAPAAVVNARMGVPKATSKTQAVCGMPGGILSISANGSTDGIVWASRPLGNAVYATVEGVLEAYDANNLNLLWSSQSDPGFHFEFGKFNPPTVAGGHVYIGTFKDPGAPTRMPAKLVVYGLGAR